MPNENEADRQIGERLKGIEQNAKEIPDVELNRMLDDAQREVSSAAIASLHAELAVSTLDPPAEQLNRHFNAKEKLLHLLKLEQSRRYFENDAAERMERLKADLEAKHDAFVADRLWELLNEPDMFRPGYNEQQQAAFRKLFIWEAKKRNLDVERIGAMSKDGLIQYLDSLR